MGKHKTQRIDKDNKEGKAWLRRKDNIILKMLGIKRSAPDNLVAQGVIVEGGGSKKGFTPQGAGMA